jgi:VanZ family protein
LLAVAIGWGEELIQRFVPGRVYDLRDVAANALGALLGLLVLVALRAGEAPAPPALNAGS